MGLRHGMTVGTLAALLTAGTALACECGDYPEILTCEKEVPRPAYSRVHGEGARAVTTYTLRLDLDGNDLIEQVTYVPGEQPLAVGTQVEWPGMHKLTITLRIDKGADRSVDAAYRFKTSVFTAARFRYFTLPDLLAEAHASDDPVAYLETYLVERLDAQRLDPAAEQQRYAAQVRMAEQRVCGQQYAPARAPG